MILTIAEVFLFRYLVAADVRNRTVDLLGSRLPLTGFLRLLQADKGSRTVHNSYNCYPIRVHRSYWSALATAPTSASAGAKEASNSTDFFLLLQP